MFKLYILESIKYNIIWTMEGGTEKKRGCWAQVYEKGGNGSNEKEIEERCMIIIYSRALSLGVVM